MLTLIVYCKNHRRRPIQFGYTPIFRDPQADIPFAWCSLCGSEVFERGQDRCSRCRSAKGEKQV